jgi:hypothetical protein
MEGGSDVVSMLIDLTTDAKMTLSPCWSDVVSMLIDLTTDAKMTLSPCYHPTKLKHYSIGAPNISI